VFRIPLILAVFLALTCTAIAAADDPADRSMLGSATAPTAVSGRPDGRTLPDAVDARTAKPPVVIRVNASDTTSFDWLAALIGALAVAGVALAAGGLLIVRHHSPTPAGR
jgi:hypothetical protein